jgi:pyruvate/2-oxoglutarate dehydrogenase complex dihydrolipoamide dehydrogenase (E3) component
MCSVTRVVVVGGGPGGYEAAMVAAQQGAEVVLVERDGIGGAAVLTDCVPSKTLVATARSANLAALSGQLGVRIDGDLSSAGVDLPYVVERILALAKAQSADIRDRLVSDGVAVIRGQGRISAPGIVQVAAVDSGPGHEFPYDVLLLATGARPRELPDARPDGDRILNWQQLWGLPELPEHLIVVGSGVTGAEFATALGSDVTLISSRDRVLPTEDPSAADVVESVFTRSGMTVMPGARAQGAEVTRDADGESDGVIVTLVDGSHVRGSHVLIAVGALPNTEGLGLAEMGVSTDDGGYLKVDRVSRTNVMGIYAAGDVTGVLALASVAAMQGRIAMWHALGDAVPPLNLTEVSSAVFTDPEIASVGVQAHLVEAGEIPGRVHTQSLASNARAKMQGTEDGFVKIVVGPDGVVRGGVVVAPRASDLIHPIALAVRQHLTADDLAQTFTVYPSMSGSTAEAARRLHIV